MKTPLILAGLIAATVIGSPPANASPATDQYTIANASTVCTVLDAYPNVSGVEGVLMNIMDDGFSPEDAGEIVGRSVIGWCPQHKPELEAFIAKWGNAHQMRT